MPQAKTENASATLKVLEAAQIAGCGERAIRNGVADGSIPHLRFGRNIRIPRSAFLRWIDNAGRTTTTK
jgi:excisionase family DNA binding protein